MRFLRPIAGLWRLRERQRVADRPHPVTILMGILGPVVAVLAITFTYFGYQLSMQSLAVSQKALETSQQTLKVGQRAYLVIENSESLIKLVKATYEPPGAPVVPSLVGDVEQSFNMRNLGRTPASLTR